MAPKTIKEKPQKNMKNFVYLLHHVRMENRETVWLSLLHPPLRIKKFVRFLWSNHPIANYLKTLLNDKESLNKTLDLVNHLYDKGVDSR